MVQCQCCTKPATIHLTNIEPGGQRHEMHLCEACAEKKQVISKQELNLSAILQSLIGTHVSGADQLARLVCPVCGIKYMEFRGEGRLGCPHDYEVFRSGLEPLLLRIHRAGRHTGKKPGFSKQPGFSERQQELIELRRQLREAVDQEAYERAAKLRDMIRQREKLT